MLLVLGFLEVLNLLRELIDLDQVLLLQLERLIPQLLQLPILVLYYLVLLVVHVLLQLVHVLEYLQVLQVRLRHVLLLYDLVGQEGFHVLEQLHLRFLVLRLFGPPRTLGLILFD